MKLVLVSILTCSVLTCPVSAHPSDATPSSKEVKLTAASWKDVTGIVKKQTGKVVVVDLWSTSCLPCVEEFPNLVALQKRHAKRVSCIAVNLDYAGIRSKPPESYRTRVENFLTKLKAGNVTNFLCTDDAITVMDTVHIGSIPAVFVYGPDGQLVKRFDLSLSKSGEDEGFSYQDDIFPLVDELLKQ